jgi:hypothetical protein
MGLGPVGMVLLVLLFQQLAQQGGGGGEIYQQRAFIAGDRPAAERRVESQPVQRGPAASRLASW